MSTHQSAAPPDPPAGGPAGDAAPAGGAVAVRRLRIVVIWSAGLVISTVLVGLISPRFLDRQPDLVWDGLVQTWVPKAGECYITRQEGKGATRVGPYGLVGESRLNDADFDLSNRVNVIFWGNSYVEGLQVNDEDKMVAQFNRLRPDWPAVAVAMSGRTVADYPKLMRSYEGVLPNVLRHVVVIGSASDLRPYQPGKQFTFVTRPRFDFRPTGWEPTHQDLKDLANDWRAGFLWHVFRDAATANLRFAPGPTASAESAAGNDKPERLTEETAAFLFAQINGAGGWHVIFVYAPSVPFVRGGQIVRADPDEAEMRIFAKVCAERFGGHFVNLADAFNDYFRKTGRFPRGFANSQPWAGHLNQAGHRLVAEAVSQEMTFFPLPPGGGPGRGAAEGGWSPQSDTNSPSARPLSLTLPRGGGE